MLRRLFKKSSPTNMDLNVDPEHIDDLEQAQRVAEVVFEYTQPVLITDARARIQKVNPAFCELMGFTEEEMLGRTPRMFRSDHHNDAFYAQMLESIKTTGVWEGEIWDRRKSGEVFPKWMHIIAV